MNLEEKNNAISEAIKLIDETLYDEAIERLKSVLVDWPEDLDVQYLLAHTYWDNKQSGHADEMAETLIEKYPEELRSNLLCADFLCRIEKPREAVLFYEKARKLCPDDLVDDLVKEYIDRGSKYWAQGNERAAVDAWLATCRFNMNHPAVEEKFLFVMENSSYYRNAVAQSALNYQQLLNTAIARDPSLKNKKLSEISMAEIIALNKEPQ